MINLPPNVQIDILASTGTLFTDLWLLLAVAIGVPLAFYIIQRIIKLVPADKPEKKRKEIKEAHFDTELADKLIREYKTETAYFKSLPLTISGKKRS